MTHTFGNVRRTLCSTAVAIAVCLTACLGAVATATASHAPRQGFGTGTPGGSGGSVVRVTNLNDAGPGSLRQAVSQGNRTVVFDVAGQILLTDYIRVRGAFVTIDGSTAPPPGITLRNHGLAIEGSAGAHDVIVRGLRVRGAAKDGIRVAYGASNVVIEHVSVHGSGDGNLDISESRDVTVAWSILAEPAVDQKNMLIKYDPARVTLHHNLFTQARQRNPQVRIDDAGTPATETTLDMRNNIVFGWVGGYGTLVWHGPRANVVGNYYASPESSATERARALEVSNGAHAYVAGNLSGDGANVNGEGTETGPFPAPAVATTSACAAAAAVLASAGVRPLDAVDSRYLAAVTLDGCSSGDPTPPPPPPAPSLPDLLVSGLNAPGSVAPGAGMTVNVTTRNAGSATAGPSSTRLYLSRDGVVDSGDATLGTLALGSLSPGAGVTTSASVTVPGGTVPGTYSILARADATGAVVEASEANNTAALAVTIATAPGTSTCQACDLVVDSLDAPRTVAPGTTFTASATALNQGAGAAPGTTLRFHLSAHRRSVVGAVDLGTVSVPALAAGGRASVSRTLTMPAGTADGKYHLVATVDAGGTASETVETNNARSRAVTVK